MLNPAYLLKNPFQHYEWGSRTAIYELLGCSPISGEPVAELWMGAHPKSPSSLFLNHEYVSLLKFINNNSKFALGDKTIERFGGKLPYLFKILAVNRPLSLQAHPTKDQAGKGFVAENAADIDLKANNRNYKDDNHKPECVCALTDFWALSGFRSVSDILDLFEILGCDSSGDFLDPVISRLKEKGLSEFFQYLVKMPLDGRNIFLSRLNFQLKKMSGSNPVFHWVNRLADAYPNDMGILAPIYLNLVHLSPGEALATASGTLHAYLHGTAIEIMANSDNVVRGGLTRKHMDIPELMRVVRFHETKIQILSPVFHPSGQWIFPIQFKDFGLSRIQVDDKIRFSSPKERGPDILICLRGNGRLVHPESGFELKFSKGDSFFVPANANNYNIQGLAELYRAYVPE